MKKYSINYKNFVIKVFESEGSFEFEIYKTMGELHYNCDDEGEFYDTAEEAEEAAKAICDEFYA